MDVISSSQDIFNCHIYYQDPFSCIKALLRDSHGCPLVDCKTVERGIGLIPNLMGNASYVVIQDIWHNVAGIAWDPSLKNNHRAIHLWAHNGKMVINISIVTVVSSMIDFGRCS